MGRDPNSAFAGWGKDQRKLCRNSRYGLIPTGRPSEEWSNEDVEQRDPNNDQTEDKIFAVGPAVSITFVEPTEE